MSDQTNRYVEFSAGSPIGPEHRFTGRAYLADVQNHNGFDRCVYVNIERGILGVPEAKRLQAILREFIDAAGPRPLHPLMAQYSEQIMGRGDVTAADEISDRLYRLDELEAER